MRSAGFSTLGCPGLPLDEVLALAKRHGADQVQLRIAEDEPVNTALSATQRATVREQFAAAGIAFGALATYVKLSHPDMAQPLREHVRLAADLGAPALRLFPGDVALAEGAQRLSEAAAEHADSGVALNVETHDAYLRGEQIAELIGKVDGPVGAIWDVLHTWRADEDVDQTRQALADRLAELQIKDVTSAADRRPLMPGTGALPLTAAITATASSGVPVVFEHEAKWYADADAFEPSLAAAMALARQA